MMPDLSQPVPPAVIVGSIAFIFLCVAAGLGWVFYWKKRRGL